MRESMEEEINLLKIDVKNNGSVVKVKGWKTFRGMVYQLRLVNKRYKKRGIKGRFTIDLPLKY